MKRLDDFYNKNIIPCNMVALFLWVTNIEVAYEIFGNVIPILFILYHAKKLWNAFNE